MSCYLIWDLDTITRSLYTRAMTVENLGNGGSSRYVAPVLDIFAIRASWEEMFNNNMELILEKFPELNDQEFKNLFIQTRTNTYFRSWILPEYKANRKEKGNILDKLFLRYVTDNLEGIITNSTTYNEEHDRFAYNSWGLEADDHISIAATKLQEVGHKVFVMTTDKDLNIIADCIEPMRCQFKEIDPSKIWKLMLGGDTADNVPNVPRYGEKTVEKTLAGKTFEEQENIVKAIFKEHNLNFSERYDVLKPVENKEYKKYKNGRIVLTLQSGTVIIDELEDWGYKPYKENN